MRIAKDTLTILSGDFVVGLTALLLNIILSRTLGVAQFGIFSIAITTLLMASSIADFGMGTSLVRFSSMYQRFDENIAADLTALTFRFMIGAAILVSAAILLISVPLAGLLSDSKELLPLIRIIAIGIFGTAVTTGILAILQSKQSFRRYALITAFTGSSKFIVILLLLSANLLNVYNAVVVFSLIPIATLFVGLLMIRPSLPSFSRFAKVPKRVTTDFFHFSKWIVFSFILVAVMSRADIIIIAYFKNSSAVGIYAAALQLSMITYTIIGSVVRVILPKISGLTERDQYIRFIKKSLTFSILACIMFSPLIFFSKDIILAVYGENYIESVGLFKLLFFTFLFIPMFQPVTMVIYALGKPLIMTLTHFSQFIVSIFGNLLLIPIYGGYGAALTLLVINIGGTLFLLFYIINKVTKSDEVIIKEGLDPNVA